MRETRSQIARGIDRVASRSAERQANAPDETPDEHRSDAGRRTARRDASGKDRGRNQCQHERTDDLAGEVGPYLAHGWNGTERAQLQILVGGERPVRTVMNPDDDGAEKCTGQLRDGVGYEFVEVAGRDRSAECHGRVQMRIGAAAGDGREHSGEHGERPPGGDGEPAGILALRSLQEHTGHDPVAEQDQDEGAGELSEER
jgi:hypothetical protein